MEILLSVFDPLDFSIICLWKNKQATSKIGNHSMLGLKMPGGLSSIDANGSFILLSHKTNTHKTLYLSFLSCKRHQLLSQYYQAYRSVCSATCLVHSTHSTIAKYNSLCYSEVDWARDRGSIHAVGNSI